MIYFSSLRFDNLVGSFIRHLNNGLGWVQFGSSHGQGDLAHWKSLSESSYASSIWSVKIESSEEENFVLGKGMVKLLLLETSG